MVRITIVRKLCLAMLAASIAPAFGFPVGACKNYVGVNRVALDKGIDRLAAPVLNDRAYRKRLASFTINGVETAEQMRVVSSIVAPLSSLAWAMNTGLGENSEQISVETIKARSTPTGYSEYMALRSLSRSEKLSAWCVEKWLFPGGGAVVAEVFWEPQGSRKAMRKQLVFAPSRGAWPYLLSGVRDAGQS